MKGEYIGTFSGVKGTPQPFFETMGRKAYGIVRTYGEDYDGPWVQEHRVEACIEKADVVSSELPNGLHAPCIDIDVPIRAIPSSTPDHWHLYIEKPMTWWKYKRLLRALVAAGVVEKGYYQASKARKGTHVRLPWVKKASA